MNIKLQHELDIRQVAELKLQLSEALMAEGNISLDAADVDAADTAGLQLLVAFVQQSRLKNKSIEWRNVTDCFLATSKLMGLDDSLGLNESL
ncbi:MAG: STAS domain-containing protein [Cycloclasticus sp.]